MKQKVLIPIIALIMLLGLASVASARMVHDFDCKNCHKPGMDLVSVSGIVCLDCHTSGMVGTTFPLQRTGGNSNPISNSTFAVGDASDAMSSVTGQSETPGDQSSHNWASLLENAAAGADRPSSSTFYGRQNSSGSYLTCSRCHDPHGSLDATSRGAANPKLLKLGPDTESAMCNDCHVSWASDTASSENGGTAPTNVHPMVTNYAAIATAKPTEYNSVVALDAADGEVALTATGGIDCLTCHGVHWTDSDSTTTDGAGQALNPGDGKVLKANGSDVDQAAVAGVSLCQTCHMYTDHGTGRTNPIGCLVCHGAHLEDTGGTMNNYMLRASITTKLPNAAGDGTVSGLVIDLGNGQTQSQRLWTYCFNCHDSAAAAITHNVSWTCSDCHNHSDTDGSWSAAGGCNTCHGYPPSENVVADGTNAGYAAGYNTSGHFKNETTTQHVAHAGGGTDYAFRCSVCHKNNDHIGGNFADTFLAPMNALVDDGGQLSSTYVAATGACSLVYCHSNGGPRGAVPTVSDPGVWDGGAAISTCDACHGNDATDMATLNNSVSHLNHLNAGYGCQVCHVDTAANATSLAAGAIDPSTGTHVNGDADVAFDGTSVSLDLSASSYGITDGTCSVYCHSNGTTLSAPDWDQPVTGKCGSCHQADGDDTGTALSDPHSIHLFDAGGPQLYVDHFDYGCDNCHTNVGSGADHVNGSISLTAGACDACHGSDGVSTTGDDRIPVWTTASSVDCETCHAGSVIATINSTAPTKNDYDAAGHGTKLSTPQYCTICHSTLADNNHLGALGDTNRLNSIVGVTYNPADSKPFCSLCHSGEDNHFGNDNSTGGATNLSTDGDNCILCHDPHGQRDKNSAALDAMVRATIGGRTVTGFTDKTDRTKYYNTVDVGEGICQTCHDPNEVNNFNRTTANTGHGGSGTCISCHPHTTTPAFKASCNGCHGDNTTGQYWPYGSGGIIPTANDQVGEHAVHVLAISQKLGYGDIAALLADADTDTKQKAICEYCHAANTNDDDHGLEANLDADVFVGNGGIRHAKFIGTGVDDGNAAYDNAADTCSNVDCHNSKLTADGSYGWHDGASNPGCILCHNDMTDTGTATGLIHSAHTGASATYGVTINCASCHDSATNWSTKTKPASNHIDGTFDMGGNVTLTYDGSLPTGSSFGSCGTNACHEDGSGSQPADNTYQWGTAEASACGICHSATPTSNDHTVHLSGTYGPNLGTDCSGCHLANANNSSMANKTTHMNGTVTFNNVAVPATPYEVSSGQIGAAGNDAVDSCDLCHGGNTAANLAKDYWPTATRVTCESCHGDYTAAEIGGITAPTRAGSAYDSWGHGRTTGNAPNQSCSDCHAESSAHISGGLGQDRLDTSPNNTYDYSVVGERNDFCNDCHINVGALNVHFDNDNTAGGSSTDGLYCVSCHDPHGQSGFDAMVKASVGGSTVDSGTQTVAGFTDRTDRTKYRDASFTGVCQACHDSEVDFFDQATDDNATHNPGTNCVSCHAHTTNPAFKAACNGCHGDAITGQYWPDGDTDTQINAANDDDGRHEAHVLLISQKLGYGNIATLLADADTDTKQKVICTYCHAVNDDDHGLEANLPAEVFNATVGTVATDVAKAIWDGSTDTDATFTKAGGSCATVDCHFNKTTTDTGGDDYTWDGSDVSACIMCHTDITNSGNLTGKSHNDHMGASGTYGISIVCTDCHESGTAWGTPGTKPGSGHLNGTFAVSKASVYPHFSYSGNWAQLGAGNQDTCGTNDCHNNGQMGAPYNAGSASYEWGDTVGFGCQICHNWGSEQPSTNAHAAHFAADNNSIIAANMSCASCHDSNGMGILHLNQTVNLRGSMDYRSGADSDIVTLGDGLYGSCNTTTCHNNGSGVAVTTPVWNRTPASADNCTICHAAVPATGTHAKHVKNTYVPSDYTNTTDSTTATDYIFACSDCHGATLSNHINTTKNLDSGLGWSSSTCTTSYCHSDGAGSYTASPNWAAGSFPGDTCAGCHGNAPTSNAHQSHQVGIHAADIYTGTTGLLAAGNGEPSSHGARWGDNVTGTSTVISCQICHFETVTVWYNDQNPTCAACHDNTAPAKGDAAIADKRKHVDGNKDVAFQPIKVASKAQLRNDITTVTEVDASWDRIKPDGIWTAIVGLFYKENDSFDRAKNALNTATMYNSGAKTCSSIACHNGVEATWTTVAGNCSSCHLNLPQ